MIPDEYHIGARVIRKKGGVSGFIMGHDEPSGRIRVAWVRKVIVGKGTYFRTWIHYTNVILKNP